MIVKNDSKKTGINASYMRRSYRDISKKEQEKYLNSIIATEYPNAELMHIQFDESLQNSDKEITYRYDYVVNNAFIRIDDLDIFRIPFTDNFSSTDFLSDNNREYPLEMWKYKIADEYSEQIYIKIPEGKQLAEMPKNVEYNNKIANYQMSFKIENGYLIAERKLTFTDDVVSKEDFAGFKEFFINVVNMDTKQIAFK
jgi:hypothetical protein